MTNNQSTNNHVVCFQLDKKDYALPLEHVERVLRMVAISSVPESPDWMSGIIDLQGRVIPVMDLRKRFHSPTRKFRSTDRLIVVHYNQMTIAITADDVTRVMYVSDSEIAMPNKSLDRPVPINHVIRQDTGLIMVLNTEKIIPSTLNEI